MASTTRRPRAALHVNGYALRAFRELQRVTRADLAAALECDTSYLSKLEGGANRRCSPAFLSRLLPELGLADRRAVLACPHAPEEHGDTHGDDGGDTGSMPTVVEAPATGVRGGRHRAARRAVTA